MKEGMEVKVLATSDNNQLGQTCRCYWNRCRDGSRNILIDILDIPLLPTLAGDSRSRKSMRVCFAQYVPAPKTVATLQWLCIKTVQNQVQASISLRDIILSLLFSILSLSNIPHHLTEFVGSPTECVFLEFENEGWIETNTYDAQSCKYWKWELNIPAVVEKCVDYFQSG